MKQFTVIKACNFLCFTKNLERELWSRRFFRCNKKVENSEFIFKDFFLNGTVFQIREMQLWHAKTFNTWLPLCE